MVLELLLYQSYRAMEMQALVIQPSLDTISKSLLKIFESMNENLKYFSFFVNIANDKTAADDMRGAKRYYRCRTMCACRILFLRQRAAFAPTFFIGAIYVLVYCRSHVTPHVPLLVS